MENFDVCHILVDQERTVDIMYAHLFTTLQLDKSYMTPYMGSDFQGLNDATTSPWGYVELLVTLKEEKISRQDKTRFLVIE